MRAVTVGDVEDGKELELTVGTGSLWPIQVSMTRRWTVRAQEVADAAIEAAAGHDQLQGLLAENEVLDVLLMKAIRAAGDSASAAKRRLMARVVREAILDDAEIDDAVIVVQTLEPLDTAHVRALEHIRRVETELDLAGARGPVARGAAKEIHQEVNRAAETYPASLLRVLHAQGLIDGSISWDGVPLITGLTHLGDELLALLHEEDLDQSRDHPPR